MKKVLLTTTALVMLAGAATADAKVALTARFGVTNNPTVGFGTQTFYRMRLNITGSGETDGGLTFGAFMRVQTAKQGSGAGTTIAGGGPRVWISNGTATLTIGNTSGAVGNTAGLYAVGGCGFSAGIDYLQACSNVLGRANTFVGSSSGGGGPNVVRLDFSLGSATVSVSMNQSGVAATANTEIAASFAVGAATIGVGYDNGAGAAGGTWLTATMDAGSATVGLALNRNNAGFTAWMLKASTAVGAGTIGVHVGADSDSGTVASTSRYGLNYAQSLGGGATAIIAVTNGGNTFGAVRTTTVSAGLTLGF